MVLYTLIDHRASSFISGNINSAEDFEIRAVSLLSCLQHLLYNQIAEKTAARRLQNRFEGY